MEIALGLSAFLCFALGHPASALLLRCGLNASVRFSPRAALALSAFASLCAAAAALIRRGGLRAAPASARWPALTCAFLGGTLGRSLLLMFVARFSGSLMLARLQAIPLLALCLPALMPARVGRRGEEPSFASLCGICALCAAIDGFFGAGGLLMADALLPRPLVRHVRAPTSLALLTALGGQAGAILLTLCVGAAQVFPARMLLGVALGAALGALAAESIQKERGVPFKGMRIALKAYLSAAVLAMLEQAFL